MRRGVRMELPPCIALPHARGDPGPHSETSRMHGKFSRTVGPSSSQQKYGAAGCRAGRKKKEDEIYVLSFFPTPPPVKYLAEGTNQTAGCKRGVNTSTGASGRQPSEEAPACSPLLEGQRAGTPQSCPGAGERFFAEFNLPGTHDSKDNAKLSETQIKHTSQSLPAPA